MNRNILIIEDDQMVRESLGVVLRLEDYQVDEAADGPEGIQKALTGNYALVMLDLRLPSTNGINVLQEIKSVRPETDVLMMTSFGTLETAVEAMKLGAVDYLTKPINDDELKLVLSRLVESKMLREENEYLKQELHEKRSHFHNLIGEDPKMQKIYSVIQAISNTDTTVLLRGESGTGKGMTAMAIHYSDASRKDGPFIEVSCGAIPRELLESELFGHVKGAFTSAIRDRVGRFELANGGTIFLDEIDALPPYLQVKLLRVLQQKVFERVGDVRTMQVNVRIIAATNRDLTEEIRKGNFREDLYYRLNVISIDIPPLRARKGDVAALVKNFLQFYSEKTKRGIKGISSEAMKLLLDYPWPGNVRELENVLERAVVLSTSEVLGVDVLPDHMLHGPVTVPQAAGGENYSLKEVLKEPEKQIICKALEQAGWNRKKAAHLLNINRTTLYNKMKEYQLL